MQSKQRQQDYEQSSQEQPPKQSNSQDFDNESLEDSNWLNPNQLVYADQSNEASS